MPPLAVVLAALLAAPPSIETPAEVTALCEAASALPDGGSTTPRRVLLAPGGLVLAPYDAGSRRLALSDRSRLSGAAGLLHVWVEGEDPLPVDVDGATAARLGEAARRGALSVALTFEVGSTSEGEPGCVHLPGVRAHVLRVDPLGWEYRDGDVVLARGGSAAEPAAPGTARVGRPVVEIAAASGDDGEPVRRAFEARRISLTGCYRAALRRVPGLDGALVAEVNLEHPGEPGAVRIAIDAIQDERLSACVLGAVATAPFPAGSGRAQVPIRFSLDPVRRTGRASRSGSSPEPTRP